MSGRSASVGIDPGHRQCSLEPIEAGQVDRIGDRGLPVGFHATLGPPGGSLQLLRQCGETVDDHVHRFVGSGRRGDPHREHGYRARPIRGRVCENKTPRA